MSAVCQCDIIASNVSVSEDVSMTPTSAMCQCESNVSNMPKYNQCNVTYMYQKMSA